MSELGAGKFLQIFFKWRRLGVSPVNPHYSLLSPSRDRLPSQRLRSCFCSGRLSDLILRKSR